MSAAPMIDVRGLGKTYTVAAGWLRRDRRTVIALDGVDFAVAPGECFGLLGPNGAGKTTLIKCLTTLLVPTTGAATIAGFDVVRQPDRVCASVGCMLMGERGLYWKLTGRENLDYFAALYFLRPAQRRQVIARLVERLGLGPYIDRAVETYSSGQRMRIAFARALIHDAPIILLDEPTNTLDVHGARDLRALVRELHAAGRTIVYSTHLLAEAEELCDRVAIVDHGRIAAVGSPRALAESSDHRGTLRVHGELPAAAVAAARAHPGVLDGALDHHDDARQLTLRLRRGGVDVGDVLACIAAAGGQVRDLQYDRPSLEETFLRLTGRRDVAQRGT